MRHIKLDRVPGNKITCICDDLENTMIFTGNTGIITFDSEAWKVIQVPNIPMAVSADSSLPLIYTGGRGFFGYLLKSDAGVYEYYGLNSEENDPGDIAGIYQTTRHVIYYGEDMIAIADRNELYNITYYRADSVNVFSGLIVYRDRAFVNLLGKGLYELSGGEFLKFETENDISASEIIFGVNYTDSLALFGLDDSRVFLFDGMNFKQVMMEDQEYLTESYLEDAVWLYRDVFAFSTILGGCLIADVASGETLNILNYNTGLPDDEIYAIGTDNNGGLWLSHQYGLTRADMDLPISSFENYPGLSGTLTAVAVLDSIVYVGTHDAIYYLEEKKEFQEKEIMVRVSTPASTAGETSGTSAETGPEETPGQENLSARELRQLKRQERREARRQGNEAAEGESPEDQSTGLKSLISKITSIVKVEEQEEPGAVSSTRYIKQKIYSLQAISHEYTLLGKLDSRAKDMVPMEDRIIVATNAGLYEIVEKQLRAIRPDWYVEGIFPTTDPGRMYVLTDETVHTMEFIDGEWQSTENYLYIKDDIYSVCEENDSTVWLGCDNLAYRICHVNDSVTTMESFEFHEEFYDPVTLRNIHDTVFFFVSGGIYHHSGDSLYETGYITQQPVSRILVSTGAITWIRSGEKWLSLKNQENYSDSIDLFLNLFSDISDLFLDKSGNVWVLHEGQHLHKIVSDNVPRYRPDFNIFLKEVYDDTRHYDLGTLQFGYYDRSIVFDLSAPFYLKENSTSYQYFVEGMSEGWSEWDRVPGLSFPALPMGRFTLHVRAKNVLNQTTDMKSFPIVIRPPFWLSWWFISLASALLITIVVLLIRWRVRKLRRDNQILEEKVRKRTAEIRKQKDEIAEQKKEIMDSIHYAQRIQKAVLPADHSIQNIMPEHFILYLPRDIVSGDFYWISSKDEKVIFTAADCTGHGVPGAFMSMLGISFLNEIVNTSRQISSGKILDQLRNHVKETLSQSEGGESKDGMDIALCILDRKNMNLQYSGAFNPLYLIRDTELTEYKADRMPIGIHMGEESRFLDHKIQLEKGDCLYIFSDGFQDQIGGEQGKKFLSKSLKALLTEVHSQPMAKQKQILYDILEQWMHGYQQVDDILVLGVRV